MNQISFFDTATELDKKFDDFNHRNPHVYRSLVKLARQAKDRGRRKIGIGMLFEVIRWEYFLNTTDEDFKLNNNYRSRYARLIMINEAGLEGIFDIRELHS